MQLLLLDAWKQRSCSAADWLAAGRTRCGSLRYHCRSTHCSLVINTHFALENDFQHCLRPFFFHKESCRIAGQCRIINLPEARPHRNGIAPLAQVTHLNSPGWNRDDKLRVPALSQHLFDVYLINSWSWTVSIEQYSIVDHWLEWFSIDNVGVEIASAVNSDQWYTIQQVCTRQWLNEVDCIWWFR